MIARVVCFLIGHKIKAIWRLRFDLVTMTYKDKVLDHIVCKRCHAEQPGATLPDMIGRLARRSK